ncbi:MAG: hypothetical protein WC130_12550 [Kiritimatiellia bacterium]|jgi:hypothetical protein
MDGFKTFLQRPYKDDMTALEWFYFFGLLIVIAATWKIILSHLQV